MIRVATSSALCADCIDKSTILYKKLLQSRITYVILTLAVTLIALKREVATEMVGFPWSECQVKKLAASHCTNNHPESGDDVLKVVKCFNS